MLNHLLNMGVYYTYIYSAYGIAFALLSIQWFIPWRRWRNYLRQQKVLQNEQNS